MRLSGRIWKDGKHWLIEVPMLDAMTQGRTRAEGVWMIADLVEAIADDESFRVKVRPGPDGAVALESSNAATLAALVLRRRREKHGL